MALPAGQGAGTANDDPLILKRTSVEIYGAFARYDRVCIRVAGMAWAVACGSWSQELVVGVGRGSR